MISIDQNLRLPDSLRSELKKPFGEVLECSKIAEELKSGGSEKPLISVGDSVSTCLIENGVSPNLIIWDRKVERHPSGSDSEHMLENYATPTNIENPPATITREAWDAINASLGEERASILVDGEEDLLTIPVVLNAPDGSRVVYGHPPDKGAILIVVGPKIRAVFRDILSRFKK